MFNSSLIKPRRRHILRGFIQVMFFMFYGLGEAHSEQNLPVFTVPQEQVHSADGFGLAHSEQNLPVFTVPHEQVHCPAGAGFGEAHSEQNLPVFTVPHAHVHDPAGAAACCASCCCPIAKRFWAFIPPAPAAMRTAPGTVPSAR